MKNKTCLRYFLHTFWQSGSFFLTCFLFLFLKTALYAQDSQGYETYQYQRKLPAATESWHKIILDKAVLAQVQPSLQDLRLIGINAKGDTLEMPYLLKELRQDTKTETVTASLLNSGKQNGRYTYTLQLDDNLTINEIALRFEEPNYERKIRLEGAQDLKNWTLILNDYRILSIRNEFTSYDFNTIRFPNSRYLYYRISFESEVEPELEGATCLKTVREQGIYKEWETRSSKTEQDKESQTTTVDFELAQKSAVSKIAFEVDSNIDFYRRMRIQYLADSSQLPTGEWRYYYVNTYEGVLSSFEERIFSFGSAVFSNKFRIIIENNNNNPLSISQIRASSHQYELWVRFDEMTKNNYLFYGSKSVYSPYYDLQNFESSVPDSLTVLALGQEEKRNLAEKPKQSPLFENPIWLWSIMGIIILILGFFSLKMLKS
ncbi:DUF3999 family protein [Hugenholtzia roseola]|uniref:DUF3999 family protein n=1 Tax=Hugenholtzia roseola TaxID=1002 RepID=UPI0003F676B0|nr:DUF3999 family protein [Hugenholtzia roseola]